MTHVVRPVALLARVLVVGLVALGVPVVLLQSPAAAAAWGVSDTTDTPVGQCAAGFTGASLREAVCSTEANPGPDAILVSAGTYTLTDGPILITQDLQIARVGASPVTINGGGGPVFDIADGAHVTLRFFQITGSDTGYAVTAGAAGGSPTDLDIESMSFTNNAGGAVQLTGGALTIGPASGSTTPSTFTNNSSPSGGGGVSFTATATDGGGQGLSIGNTTFSGNSTASQTGGAVQVTSQPGVTTQINNSRFVGNTSTGTGGGALGQTNGSLSVTRSSFSGNTASGAGAVGGAVFATSLGSATLNYDRFAGNTSTTGADVHTAVPGTVDAEHNWFGCNGGSGTPGCDTISGGPGAVDADPWLVFDGSGPSTVDGPDGTADVAAGVTRDSDGVAVAANNRAGFQGVGVAWSNPLPSPSTVSPASSGMASGLAHATYDSESAPAGPGSVTATLDNESVVIPFDVRLRPVVTDDPDDVTVAVGDTATFTAAATGDPTPTVQWESSTDGSAWDPISGATDSTLSFTAVAGDDGNQYRAVFTNVADTDTTAPATLTIGTESAFTSADHATFTIGTNGTFAVTTTGAPAPAITYTGALPTGVTLTDNGDGTATLAGTPAAGTAGDYDLALHADNVIGDDNQDFTLTVVKAGQTLSFTTSAPSSAAVGDTYDVSATATSGLTAALSAGPGAVCTLAAGTVTFVGVGTCTVTAQQAGDSTYAAAAPATQTIDVGTAPAITSAYSTTFTIGTNGTFTVTVSGEPAAAITHTGALPTGVTLTDNGDGTATLAGTPAAGTAGDYDLALHADNGIGDDDQDFTLTVVKVSQSVAFTTTAPAAAPVGDTYDVAATATSGLTAALSAGPIGVCTLAAGTVTFVGVGTCTVTAQQAGNGTYAAATPDTQTITVGTAPAITSADSTTFTIGSNGTFTVTTTGDPAAAITHTGVLPTGVTLTDNGDGTATLAGTPATGTAGDYDLGLDAANVIGDDDQDFTLTVVRAAQTVAITTTAPTLVPVGDTYDVAATASSGLTAALSAGPTGVCTLAADTVTFVGVGTCTVTAQQAGNGTYAAATPDTQNIDVGTAPAITSADTANFVIGIAGTVTVTTTGDPEPAIAATGVLPGGVTFTDNGDGTATLTGIPDAGSNGSYDLDIHTDNPLGDDDQDFTLTVAKAGQTLAFTTGPPGGPSIGATYAVAATATSGLTAALSAGPGSVCTLVADTVTFVGVGTCTVTAQQAGNGTYAAAVPATQLIAVGALIPDISLELPGSSVYGEPVRVETFVAGALSGEVQYYVDDHPVGARVPVVDGLATSPVLADPEGAPLEPGSYDVVAAFFPDDPDYTSTSAFATQVVGQAATTVEPTVSPTTVSATVTPVAPGAGLPTGEVELRVDGVSVGTAPLEDGVATVATVVEPGETHSVAAIYAGDDRFTASSGSTARHDPIITATIVSPVAMSAHGWYRQPVTVWFTCTPDGAPLTAACPGPVRVRRDAAARTVARTIHAVDGGAATASVVVRLDQVAPRLVVRGLHKTHPRPRCVAHDSLSGVASCTIVRRVARVEVAQRVAYRAIAVDRAGNRTVVRGHYWAPRAG